MTREDKLIQQIQQGDTAAAEELIKMYYSEILRYCLWHAPDRSLAQDAAQETFMKALRYFDHYTHKGNFRPFLYRIAANTCIDMHRRSRPPDLPLFWSTFPSKRSLSFSLYFFCIFFFLSTSFFLSLFNTFSLTCTGLFQFCKE